MSDLLREDTLARKAALNPQQSFIVQAPAGSGKTELLTQRYLVLLKHAKRAPEEVLAVTFTRKAQAEMRGRIIEALKLSEGPRPEAEHKQLTWQLGKDVLAQSSQKGWDLLNNPNRLRIMTIDALAHYLVARMPILSQFGSQATLSTHPEPLYQQAIAQFLQQTTQDKAHKGYLEDLLWHLDNSLDKLESLLIKLLTKRDQWLSHVYPFNQNPSEGLAYLEAAITRAIEQTLANAYDRLIEFKGPIASALSTVQEAVLPDKIASLQSLHSIPAPEVSELPAWRALVTWFLTDKGEFRQKVTKAQGFVAPSSVKDKAQQQALKEAKSSFEALLNTMQGLGLEKELSAIQLLPEAALSKEYRLVLRALFELLPLIVAHLKVVFKDKGEVDFIEIAQAALNALGDEDNPTDLALSLDYQFNHILIDEFQDTSVTQFDLFEKLLRGWQQGDGRTLFLVGDPQQSIYRFRGAEVGLFLKAKEHGIGGTKLNFLQLRRNFRSHATIVDWCNQVFSKVFPKQADISLGAVPFSLSIAEQQQQGQVDVLSFADAIEEFCHIGRFLEQAQTDTSKVILVRARSHLEKLIPILNAFRIPFMATDLEPIATHIIIRDLIALTKAWANRADRLSWVSLLRAPWCGLAMNDIWVLAKDKSKPNLYLNLQDESLLAACSEDGKQRLARLNAVIQLFSKQDGRQSFAQTIKALWIQLGGASCYPQLNENMIELYFQCLHDYTQHGPVLDWQAFESFMANQYSEPVAKEGAMVELMTVHKAKGLEYDVVMMPALHKKPRGSDSELLLWQERPYDEGVDLLMAPAKGPDLQDDRLYHYLNEHIQQKDFLESARLLYVGATRAKQLLMLSFSGLEDKPPAKTSFLGLMHTAIADQITMPLGQSTDSIISKQRVQLKAGWQLPEFLQRAPEEITDKGLNRPEMDLNFESAVGTCVHKIFELIAKEGLELWRAKRLDSQVPIWQHYLKRLGVSDEDMPLACDLVSRAIANTLADDKGKWILGDHAFGASEFKLSKVYQGKMQQSFLDRVFRDNEGQWWIVDYKVVQKEPNPNDYLAQLDHYAKLFSKVMPEQRIKVALYFPIQSQFWEKPS